MKENCMSQIEEEIKLHIKPRATEAVFLQIPVDAMRSLEQVAISRDMSLEALLKFYIGQSLRQDLAKLFGDRLLETTSAVLARHLDSKEEISNILQEIQTEVTRLNSQV